MTTFDSDTSPSARRLGLIWTLLMVNVMPPIGAMLIPLPRTLGQLITMGCLAVAFLLALEANPQIHVRFSIYLVILTLLVVVAFVSSYQLNSGLSSLARCARFMVFVATLWLLCPWWRGDMKFLRFHINVLVGVLCVVLAPVPVVPGMAFYGGGGGRLTGILWPIPPTQVGEYGAVITGLAALMWITRVMETRRAVVLMILGLGCTLLSHTRTALGGLFIGLAIAGATLIFKNRRARRVALAAMVLGAFAALASPDTFLNWYQRDQTADDVSNLSGRQKVWDALIAQDRTPFQQALGNGLSDKSFDGLPIDSAWLSTYHELGWVGVSLVVGMLVSLLVVAVFGQLTPARRCALFLIVYCSVASYTEVGLSDASPYLLHLAVATSLLLPPYVAHLNGRSSSSIGRVGAE